MHDIRQWLDQIGLGEYADLFAEQRIDRDVLLELTDQDLKEFGLPFGDRKRLLRAINTRRERICSALFWSSESLALHGMGRRDEAMELIQRAIEYCRETGDRWMEPEVFRIKGEFLLAENPQPEAATGAFKHALELARSRRGKSWELRAATRLARLWRSQNQNSEAENLLAPIYDWFAEGFDTADLKQAKELLVDIG